MSNELETADDQLAALEAQMTEQSNRRYVQTANRLAREMARKARAEGRLLP